ncbi:MAG: tetratricopeptide repeat protein [bacterium]|nr:MAG: tetratricopeptide repeat protein [bacterium]
MNLWNRSVFRFACSFVLILTAASCASTKDRVSDAERDGELYYELGVRNLVEGNIEKAFFELAKAERLKPKDAKVHFALGTAYLYRGQAEMAVESFRKTVRLDPGHADAYNNLGAAYLMLKRWDEAIEACQKALDQLGYRTPEKALTIMGWAHYKKGEPAEAVNLLRRALSVSPKAPDPSNKLAEIYLEQGNIQKAKPILQELVRTVPQFAKARLNMGIVYYKERDFVAARDEFQAVIELSDRDSEDAQLARGYLDLIE